MPIKLIVYSVPTPASNPYATLAPNSDSGVNLSFTDNGFASRFFQTPEYISHSVRPTSFRSRLVDSSQEMLIKLLQERRSNLTLPLTVPAHAETCSTNLYHIPKSIA